MIVKASFSEKPDKIKYVKIYDGHADVWLRKNIEEVSGIDEKGNEYTYWQADENYFRVKSNKMSEQYVIDNFNKLVNYNESDISYSGESSLEDRISDLESTIVDLLDIIGGLIE